MCVIHEVEVDMIKKDNLSLYHYNVFLVFLILTYYRSTVGSIMLTSELVYNHSFKFILFCYYLKIGFGHCKNYSNIIHREYY